jgi:hypothetical protein
VPDNWCRYISVDPGRQVCAVLFAAIPPPAHREHDRVFIYDELYIRRCDALKFADELYQKVNRQNIYEAIIDSHMGRYTEVASGKTIEEQYREACLDKRIRFENVNGVAFTWCMDDVKAGISAVHSWLHQRPDGTARLVVFKDRCPNLCSEMEKYCYKKNKTLGVMTDEPLKIHDHTPDALGYMAMHGLPYRRPRARSKGRGNYAFRYLEDKKARKIRQNGFGRSIKVG